ncbi:general secretion pathway protein I [Bordetella ansorpii]|uniref:Type II secretion system protein I n=1 Tax=Bordetella ansorpii TaxID=288768 RepID=A0A157SF67_9BORD|nr:type II secretion system minor pseudopilin GspI [Bordetella ansorpii]SAI69098.1 general secretion pathway protein I [Bordetella ansorpii]
MHKPLPRHRTAQTGFTLIEVLVALAIVGIALAAVMRTMGVMTQNNGKLRDRSLAMMSAENRLNELDLEPGAPAPGGQRFACPQGSARFMCEQRVDLLKTGFRKVTVDVYETDDSRRLVATLSRVLGRVQ